MSEAGIDIPASLCTHEVFTTLCSCALHQPVLLGDACKGLLVVTGVAEQAFIQLVVVRASFHAHLGAITGPVFEICQQLLPVFDVRARWDEVGELGKGGLLVQ